MGEYNSRLKYAFQDRRVYPEKFVWENSFDFAHAAL